ncbi:MAG: hypothetical protein R3B72_44165 [Polyangiaceae bacterium]
MDPALERLVLNPSCRQGGSQGGGSFYDPTSAAGRCLPNHAAFGKLVTQLGAVVAPPATHPARTTGFGGYRFGIQANYTNIDSNASYWQQGTQGPKDEATGQDSVVNRDPAGIMQMYNVYLAKGFPFGLELGAGFGFLANTEIISGGGDVRIAIFEGFRDSIPGFIPDVGVGGGVRTITGTSQLKLTVASLDAQISKPIPIAGTVTLHPHVGYQLLWIFGDSGLIDLTPNTDEVTACGYQGDNNPSLGVPVGGRGFDGQPNCSNSSADINNSVVFDRIHLVNRHRINFGMQLRYQMVQFGLSFLTDVVSPLNANKSGDTIIEDAPVDPTDPSGRTVLAPLNRLADDPRTPEDDEVKRQWTLSLELGAVF